MNRESHWLKHYWRPLMAFQYLTVCIFDFVIFPLLTMFFSYLTGNIYEQWDPITLAESGFYHLSMGAIIGVAAWTRGQEKIRNLFTGEISESSSASQTPK
jgi:hypothetical protein